MQQDSNDPTGPANPPAFDDELAALADDLAGTVAEIREEARWVGANLREMMSAFGLGAGSPPTGPEADRAGLRRAMVGGRRAGTSR